LGALQADHTHDDETTRVDTELYVTDDVEALALPTTTKHMHPNGAR